MPNGTDEGIKQCILALETQRCDAMIGADTDALGRLFADDLFYVHSSSRIDTKASFIESIRSGALKYREIVRDELKVRVWHANTAVATGRAKVTSTSNGETRTMTIRYTNVWIRVDSGGDTWRFSSWHAAVVPAGAA